MNEKNKSTDQAKEQTQEHVEEQVQEPVKLASWKDQPEQTEKPIYNFAGVFADVVYRVETELSTSCLENRRPWKSDITKDVDTGTISFTNVEVPEIKMDFTVGVNIRILKDQTDKENPLYTIEIDLLINEQTFGQLRHITGADVYEHALNRFNNQYNCIN